MSKKIQCPNCGSYTFKEKTTGGCMYLLAIISFFGGTFITYVFGSLSALLDYAVLFGIVLSLILFLIQSKLDSIRSKKTGQIPMECNNCQYEGVIDLRD